MRKSRQPSKSHKQPIEYPLLCLDCETTVHGELLELSVYDIAGNEVYHRYFKPRAKKWPTDIHHITPEQVRNCNNFRSHRAEVRKLLASTHYLVGCALNNDLRILQRNGVTLPQHSFTVLDIQNWYWLMDDPGRWHTRTQTGLAAIAETYGVDFGNGHAHSASADTMVTLECLRRMMKKFDETYPDDTSTVDSLLHATGDTAALQDGLHRLNARFRNAYDMAMQHYAMYNAGGYINVLKREQGYSLKYSKGELTVTPNVVFSVPVEDRELAEQELREHFLDKQVRGLTGIYAMDQADFEYIKSYRNAVDPSKYLKTRREKPEKGAGQQKEKASLLPQRPVEVKKPTPKPKTRRVSKTRAATHAMRVAKKKV